LEIINRMPGCRLPIGKHFRGEIRLSGAFLAAHTVEKRVRFAGIDAKRWQEKMNVSWRQRTDLQQLLPASPPNCHREVADEKGHVRAEAQGKLAESRRW